MRSAVLLLIALALCLVQYSWLARWPVTPDLPLALAAWAMVDGTEEGVLWRAWLVGVVADFVDPGSEYFHAIAFLLLALAYLPVRSLVFRTRSTGWAPTAFWRTPTTAPFTLRSPRSSATTSAGGMASTRSS